MKKSHLQKIIKEEISKLLKEELYKGGSISWHSEQSKMAIENLLKSYNLPYEIKISKSDEIGFDGNEVNFESKEGWDIKEKEDFKKDFLNKIIRDVPDFTKRDHQPVS